MSNTEYSEEFKNNILKKVFTPNQGKTFKMISEEAGVPYSTLMRWKKESNTRSVSRSKSKKEFSVEDKLNFITKQDTLSESEFGELLRREGVLQSDVDEWRREALEALKKPVRAPGRPKKDPLLKKLEKKVKQLENNLNYKDKALAEMSARVILIKKSQKLFGLVDSDDEDDL